jgi:hypothetical protein
MWKYQEINHDTDISLVSKFNNVARLLGLSVLELFYDGSDFYKYVPEDNYYQQLLVTD